MTTETMPAQRLTARSVVIGIVGCIVLTAVSMYTALKLGALPWPIVFAAIIALLFLRLCGSRDLHEANVAHTMMTAGSMVAGGLAFTIPGILILGAGEVTVWQLLLVSFAGTLLGLAATMLFRKRFVDDEPMEYPIGEAAAQTLIGADAGGRTAAFVFIPMALAAAYAWIRDRMAKLPAVFFMKGQFPGVSFGLYNSPMMVAVGFLMGAVPMLVWFAGALIGDFGLVWGASQLGVWDIATGQGIKSSLGMGLMIGGGLAVVAKVLADRVRKGGRGSAAGEAKGGQASHWAARIANPKAATLAVIGFTALAFVLCLLLKLGVVASLVVIVLVWVAAVMSIICVGHTGIDPMEVFGLIVMLAAAALSQIPVMGMFFVAAVIAVACGLVGDVMNDFHAGRVLSTSPRNQYIAQTAGALIGAVVAALTMYLLMQAYGADAFGVGKTFIATQASTVALLVGGIPNVPAFIVGLVLGIGLYFVKVPTVMLGLGVYLPFLMSLAAGLGGLLRLIFDLAVKKRGAEEKAQANTNMVLVSSGILGGESITGVIIAFLAMAGI